MGMPGPVSKSAFSTLASRYPVEVPVVRPGEPDPRNWKLLKHAQVGNVLIVKIRYPEARNYEGVKILVFLNTTVRDLRDQKLVDPHFSDAPGWKSPFARFEPTEKGWKAARYLAHRMDGES